MAFRNWRKIKLSKSRSVGCFVSRHILRPLNFKSHSPSIFWGVMYWLRSQWWENRPKGYWIDWLFFKEILKIMKFNCDPVLRQVAGLAQTISGLECFPPVRPKSMPPSSVKRLLTSTRAARLSRARAISVYRKRCRRPSCSQGFVVFGKREGIQACWSACNI
jgi:hypothetical protein